MDHGFLQRDESVLAKKFKLEAQIRSIKQGDKSIDEIYAIMVELWDQMGKLEPYSLRESTHYKQLQDQCHLVQLLLSLRDEFEPLRRSLLARSVVPSLEEAVNLLKIEESKLRSSTKYYSKGKFAIDMDHDDDLPLSKFSSMSLNAKENQESEFSGGMLGKVAKFAAASVAVAGASWALSDYLGGSGNDTVKLKILSYNVCFWDLELEERMNALGRLIQLHSPDVICLQEVTSDIYTIFCQSKWWDAYKCSVSIHETRGRSYFCIQLSRLPVNSFSRWPFRNSRMGRELCIANIEVSSGTKPLIIATSHLESPTPAPPTFDQMNSETRVAQAKEALNHLQRHPNVIFCGDMNWDESTDGSFPLFEGWLDAWTDLRGRENGWTYDTKSNQMLSANRPLQKRLDRFICKMKDFSFGGISMIGTEAIPGVTYLKEKRVRNRMQTLELPVYASDHYGLLLEIRSK